MLAYVLGDLALILIVARIVGSVFARFGQPRVVGEIVAGILVGPTVLGGHIGTATVEGAGLVDRIFPAQAFSFLSLIGQVGLVLFMFLVGLELDERLLAGRGRQILVVAVAAVAVPAAFGFLAAFVLDSETWKPAGVGLTTFALFLGAGLAVTAFPVMARILQEKNLMATDMGAVGIGASAVVTVLMFLLIAGASASAKGSGAVNEVGFKVLLTIGLLAARLASRVLTRRLVSANE